MVASCICAEHYSSVSSGLGWLGTSEERFVRWSSSEDEWTFKERNAGQHRGDTIFGGGQASLAPCICKVTLGKGYAVYTPCEGQELFEERRASWCPAAGVETSIEECVV